MNIEKGANRRSRSLPPKRTAKKPAWCLFLRLRGKCVWGSLCAFRHEVEKKRYVERPPSPPPSTPQSRPEYLRRLEEFQRQLRRQER